jgi:phage shock protein C
MKNRLIRSRANVMLGGVCAGLGDYLNIDATLVRIFFILLGLTGTGVWIYLLLWLVIPREDLAESKQGDLGERFGQVGKEFGDAVRQPNPNTAKFIGFALVLGGLVLLGRNLDIYWLRWLNGDILWPLILIVGGGTLMWRAFRGE